MSYFIVAFIIASGFLIYGQREQTKVSNDVVEGLKDVAYLLRDIERSLDKPALPSLLEYALEKYAKRPTSTVSEDQAEAYKKGLDDGATVLSQMILEQLKVKETTNA